MKIGLLLLAMIFSICTYAEEKKKTLKQNINETADQIDSGVRKSIKEVKTLVKPKEKKP